MAKFKDCEYFIKEFYDGEMVLVLAEDKRYKYYDWQLLKDIKNKMEDLYIDLNGCLTVGVFIKSDEYKNMIELKNKILDSEHMKSVCDNYFILLF